MDTNRRAFASGWAMAALAVIAALGAVSCQRSSRESGSTARFADWDEMPRSLALLMIERHGEPEQMTSKSLVWREKTPWKRIIVHNDPPNLPLEQVVSYFVPDHKLEAVRSLGNGIGVDVWNNELSAQNEMESMNFLALNLADDIVRDNRTTQEAATFLQTTAQLAASGKSSLYMEGLLFRPRKEE